MHACIANPCVASFDLAGFKEGETKHEDYLKWTIWAFILAILEVLLFITFISHFIKLCYNMSSRFLQKGKKIQVTNNNNMT